MTGVPFLIVFVVAVIIMILLISKFKVHPFLSILLVSLCLGIIGGMTPDQGYKIQTVSTLVMGICSIAFIFVLTLFL